MSHARAYSRISALVSCRLRLLDRLADRALFHESAPAMSSSQKLAGAHLPEPLLEFLLTLDAKLDMLLALVSRRSIEYDFPLRGKAVEIGAEGIRFVGSDTFASGQRVEIVLFLSHAPLRLAGALGEIVGVEQSEGESLYTLDFTTIRDRDRESIVQFVFQEERAQIRESKWI